MTEPTRVSSLAITAQLSKMAASTAKARVDGSLSPEQVQQFHQDGYLLIPNFFDTAEPLRRARELVSTFDLAEHSMTKFTDDLDDDVPSSYFLGSAHKVRCFLEEGAIGTDGKLKRPQDLAVNKVGHALHVHDPVFHALSFSQCLQHLARSLGAHKDPRVLQSMVICKPLAIGGAVSHHNDSTFLYSAPPSAMASGSSWRTAPNRTVVSASFQGFTALARPRTRPLKDPDLWIETLQ